jgi:hypothetical protein
MGDILVFIPYPGFCSVWPACLAGRKTILPAGSISLERNKPSDGSPTRSCSGQKILNRKTIAHQRVFKMIQYLANFNPTPSRQLRAAFNAVKVRLSLLEHPIPRLP